MRPSLDPVLDISMPAASTNSALARITLNHSSFLSFFTTGLGFLKSFICICHILFPRLSPEADTDQLNQRELQTKFCYMSQFLKKLCCWVKHTQKTLLYGMVKEHTFQGRSALSQREDNPVWLSYFCLLSSITSRHPQSLHQPQLQVYVVEGDCSHPGTISEKAKTARALEV